MPLINIIVIVIVAGVSLWAVNRYIPMASSVKTILNVVVEDRGTDNPFALGAPTLGHRSLGVGVPRGQTILPQSQRT
jgi:hypothetical protein